MPRPRLIMGSLIAVMLVSAGAIGVYFATRHSPKELIEAPATTAKPSAVTVDASSVVRPTTTPPLGTQHLPPSAAELPAISEVLHPTLREFVDKTAKNRLPTNFPILVPTITQPNDILAVLRVLHDATDLDSIRNEAANLLRRSNVPDLGGHLIAILDNPVEHERFRSFSAQHAGDIMTELVQGTEPHSSEMAEAIRSRLVLALDDQHLMVRREALLALTRERHPHAVAIIRSGLNDPLWAPAQDLLVRCAHEAGLTDLIPAIRPLAYSSNETVRIAAVNVLAQWKDEASRPAFEEASRSSVARIQRAGDLAMRLIAVGSK